MFSEILFIHLIVTKVNRSIALLFKINSEKENLGTENSILQAADLLKFSN